MEFAGAGGVLAADQRFNGVRSGGGHIDGVLHPFTSFDIGGDVHTSLSGGCSVDVFGGDIETAGIAGDVVVISHAFATLVEVFRFERSEERRVGKECRCRWSQWQ